MGGLVGDGDEEFTGRGKGAWQGGLEFRTMWVESGQKGAQWVACEETLGLGTTTELVLYIFTMTTP